MSGFAYGILAPPLSLSLPYCAMGAQGSTLLDLNPQTGSCPVEENQLPV